MNIANIAQELYNEQPTIPLFHYTSLRALLGIVGTGALHATDVHFFSDAAELHHTASLLRNVVGRAPDANDSTTRLRQQFIGWLQNRLMLGHAIFVACFTANGNLLSQWRSYCEPSKGVSLGFAPDKLCMSAAAQSFHVGRCIYESKRQLELDRKSVV